MKWIYSFVFVLCSLFIAQAETMVIGTYNIRNANAGDSTNGNGWGQRYPYVAQLVQFHGFGLVNLKTELFVIRRLKLLKRDWMLPVQKYFLRGHCLLRYMEQPSAS